MDQLCPRCGLSVGGQLRCPLCDTSLVQALNLRRTLLWTLVVEEYLLALVVLFRYA
jgi:hypothetical protein